MSEKKTLKSDLECPIVMVWTTVGDPSDAQKLASELVEKRLAACIQIDGPVTSVYRWKDVIETETEYRLLIKTNQNSVDRLQRWIGENHPYDEPEFIVTPLLTASQGYTQWVVEQTAD